MWCEIAPLNNFSTYDGFANYNDTIFSFLKLSSNTNINKKITNHQTKTIYQPHYVASFSGF